MIIKFSKLACLLLTMLVSIHTCHSMSSRGVDIFLKWLTVSCMIGTLMAVLDDYYNSANNEINPLINSLKDLDNRITLVKNGAFGALLEDQEQPISDTVEHRAYREVLEMTQNHSVDQQFQPYINQFMVKRDKNNLYTKRLRLFLGITTFITLAYFRLFSKQVYCH